MWVAQTLPSWAPFYVIDTPFQGVFSNRHALLDHNEPGAANPFTRAKISVGGDCV
jgi:hypothetical protein